MSGRLDGARWPLALAVSAGLHAVAFLALPEPPQAPVLEDWGALVMVAWPDPVWITEPPPRPSSVTTPAAGNGGAAARSRTRGQPEAPATVAPPAPRPGVMEEGEVVLRAGAPLRVGAAPPATAGGTSGAEAARPPRCRPPRVAVPATVKEDQLEGRVDVSLTIEADGQVGDVVVTTPLRDDADRACVDAWSRVRCRPARRNEVPVRAVEVAFSCRFEQRTGL